MEVDKEHQAVIDLMTAYGCSAEKAREFIKHTDTFARAMKHADAGLITREQAAVKIGGSAEDVQRVDEMMRAENDTFVVDEATSLKRNVGFVVHHRGRPGEEDDRRFVPFGVPYDPNNAKRSTRMSPAFAAPYGVTPGDPIDYEKIARIVGMNSEGAQGMLDAFAGPDYADMSKDELAGIVDHVVVQGRWGGRVLEVTSEEVKVASLVEFAGTKQGRQAIEEELARRAAEDNPKIRSAEGKEGSRKQRREMARRMNKAIRKAKAAGVKR